MTTAKRPKHPRAIVGVDLGATSLSAGLVTRDGEILDVVEAATNEHGANGVEQIIDIVRELHTRARRRGIDVEGVGVGLPGIVDTDKGMMTGDGGTLVPELAKIPLADRIREATGLLTFVENDVNALALAEHRYGVGRGARSLVVLALGTGPGGGIVLNGELVRGRSGYGGEFGHVPVMLDGPPCVCGGHGCMSFYVAGVLLARRARQALPDHPGSKLLAMAGGDAEAITARTVFEAAAAGDALAVGLVDQACEALAAGLGIILNSLNPDVVVVTGGLAAPFRDLEADVLRRTARYAFARVLADTIIRIVPSSKRDTVRGGAALFLYESERRDRAARRPSSARPRKRG
jgi:glucokinase